MLWVTIDEHAAVVRERDAAQAEVAHLRRLLRRAEADAAVRAYSRAAGAISGADEGQGKGAGEIVALTGAQEAGCPAPHRKGRHEWYLVPGSPGYVCRACGARSREIAGGGR